MSGLKNFDVLLENLPRYDYKNQSTQKKVEVDTVSGELHEIINKKVVEDFKTELEW